jgi:hypothetical protein
LVEVAGFEPATTRTATENDGRLLFISRELARNLVTSHHAEASSLAQNEQHQPHEQDCADQPAGHVTHWLLKE